VKEYVLYEMPFTSMREYIKMNENTLVKAKISDDEVEEGGLEKLEDVSDGSIEDGSIEDEE
jgi:hypothetical protein